MDFSPVVIGAITTAIIAGLISLLGLIISKENKTSEFRQQWIDCFRNEISDFLGRASSKMNSIHIFQATMNTMSTNGKNEYLDKFNEELREVQTLYWKLCIRMNPKEHVDIRAALDSLNDAVSQSIHNDVDIQLHQKKLVEKTQIHLKKEWERVKKGEPFFRITKWCLVTFIVVVLIWANFGEKSGDIHDKFCQGENGDFP